MGKQAVTVGRSIGARLAVVVWLALLCLVCACAGGAREPSAQPSASVAMPLAFPSGDGAIDAGTYRMPKSAWSVADFTVTMPPGWTVQYGHTFLKHSDAPGEVGFYAVVVDTIFADACGLDEALAQVGPSVDDLAAALLQQPGPRARGPVDTTLGGYRGVRVDMTVPADLELAACRLGGLGLQVWYSEPADKHFVLLPDGVASVYILDVAGRRQVFLTQHRAGTSEEDLAELRTILDSIDIGA